MSTTTIDRNERLERTLLIHLASVKVGVDYLCEFVSLPKY